MNLHIKDGMTDEIKIYDLGDNSIRTTDKNGVPKKKTRGTPATKRKMINRVLEADPHEMYWIIENNTVENLLDLIPVLVGESKELAGKAAEVARRIAKLKF
jgi:hypothetical protein